MTIMVLTEHNLFYNKNYYRFYLSKMVLTIDKCLYICIQKV